jgi:polysaccharide pyruvyl transferase WcaK-like protein
MAVIANLRGIFPDGEIIGICSDPRDTECTHGIPAFPISGLSFEGRAECRRQSRIYQRALHKLLNIYEKLLGRILNIAVCCRSLDLLLIAGSGQLDDFWGGPWKHPFSMLIWSLFSRIYGAQVVVFGIGWDDLSTRLGKFFAFSALRLTHYRSFRDKGTVQKLLSAGFRLASEVCPDPAFGLPTPTTARAENAPVVIMVCPIGARAWLKGADSSYAAYLESLVNSCRQWLDQGYRLWFASSQIVLDTPIAKEIASRLRTMMGNTGLLHVYEAQSVSQYLELARNADLVVGSRLHALILTVVAETPLVAVSYGRKVTQMMVDLGLSEYCLELTMLRAEALNAAVSRAIKNREQLRDGLARMLVQYRKELDIQYETIQRLLVGHA